LAGCGVDGDDVLHDWLPVSRFGGAFVEQIVNQPTFRDVCAKSGKWFHARENCFVARPATKQSGIKNASDLN
jgi:hypothetical protein